MGDQVRTEGTEAYRIAVASSDGIVVNQHFGKTDIFYIYTVNERDEVDLIEVRRVSPVCCRGDHDENRLQSQAQTLADCKYVLVSRIGIGAANALEQCGVLPLELPGMIEESVHRLIAYNKVQELWKGRI